jgi:hypothetical protein
MAGERADIIDEMRSELRMRQKCVAPERRKNRIDGVRTSYILVEGQLPASARAPNPTRQTSVIVKVQSPLARRSVRRSSADRRGMHPDRRFLSDITILSRRSVRRRNAVATRAFIAVHCVRAASLLP